ncbi:MAG TPA: hypothetical protein VMX17_15705 [Candidatus Glassbacteria bacterium]|nr:hypothetical protein [Candidatus Glassbacteria bacterium]
MNFGIVKYTLDYKYSDMLSPLYEALAKKVMRERKKLEQQIKRLLEKGFLMTDIHISLRNPRDYPFHWEETVMVRYRSGWREFELGE